jgi:hypothetical protein
MKSYEGNYKCEDYEGHSTSQEYVRKVDKEDKNSSLLS